MKSSSFSKQLRKSQTDVESILWNRIRNRQLFKTKFRRQHVISPYVVDFISTEYKLIIELDGGQHNNPKRKIYDKKRTRFLENNGYKVIRFWDSDILSNMEGVLEIIAFNLNKPSSQPSPYE